MRSAPAVALAAAAPLPPLPAFGSRASNSKPILPSGCRTRKAENGRPFLEMNFSNSGDLPVSSNFIISSRAMVRFNIILPERKSQVLAAPNDFSQAYELGISNTFDLHFGQGPSDCWPEKSGGSASSPAPSPQENSMPSSLFKIRFAENARPNLLRKPSSGPTSRFAMSVSASAGSS